jgi:hypothetical protein
MYKQTSSMGKRLTSGDTLPELAVEYPLHGRPHIMQAGASCSPARRLKYRSAISLRQSLNRFYRRNEY